MATAFTTQVETDTGDQIDVSTQKDNRSQEDGSQAIHRQECTVCSVTQVVTGTYDQIDNSTQESINLDEDGRCSQPIYAFNLLIRKKTTGA